MPIYQYQGRQPTISSSSFIFDNAVIIGDVTIGRNVSIWASVVIRADNDSIVIGDGSNVQEASVLHVDPQNPLNIGPNVTIGHQATLHGCTIGEGSMIGIGAVVLNRAKIGRNCLVGAGAIIPEGKQIPDGSLVIGVGKIARGLTAEDIATLHANTASYVEKCGLYKDHMRRLS
ncbi:gamma carbonic anhydrase family protein [Paraburkholderia phenoliruptrix]|uniref:gamma carbonic anhydrase family protein n=1 Tax=Paraburkholderia phenoliruptrix TaxID=252970 RepID=UPI0034CD4D12